MFAYNCHVTKICGRFTQELDAFAIAYGHPDRGTPTWIPPHPARRFRMPWRALILQDYHATAAAQAAAHMEEVLQGLVPNR